MFEEMTDRIAGTLLTGLDVAVEFATLGEFRLVGAAAPAPFDHEGFAAEAAAPALPLMRRPQRAPKGITPDLLPKPATAIARATATATVPTPAQPPRRSAKPGSVVPSAPRRRPGTTAKPQH